MATQTITGNVQTAAGEDWAGATVEIQFDNGTGEFSGQAVAAVTDNGGDFEIQVVNNSDAARRVLLRLPDASLFALSLDPEDTDVDAGTLSAYGTTSEPLLAAVPGTYAPAEWGDITGDVTDQTDLQSALDDKIEGVAWGDVTGTLADQTDLQAALDAKADV